MGPTITLSDTRVRSRTLKEVSDEFEYAHSKAHGFAGLPKQQLRRARLCPQLMRQRS